jgi:pyruvate/2-oxoglutarate dehydrogenase complex dihydrolipoamide dehydrogenase (E3) component
MADYEFDMGIIGGGAAGLTVASGAAQLGAKTLLVEKEPELGGDCLHYGCVPSKTLIKSAHLYHQMMHADHFGLPAVDLPPVDFAKLSQRIRSVISSIQHHDSEARFCGLGVKVVIGPPRFVDEHSVEVNDQVYAARQWVLATGSSPALPPIPGLDQTEHITNREIFFMDRLPARMIVLGAGPIGIEMSQAFNRLGSRVTVISNGDRILAKDDKDLTDELKQIMAAEGVEFRLQSNIDAVRAVGNQKEVTFTGPDGRPERLQADAVLVSLGRRANIRGLGLEKIGVQVNPGGVQVDNRLRTTQKHIFAAGDCNGGFQFTHAAGYEGGVVVANAVFHLPRRVDYTWLPWCTYTDPELASIGMNEQSARAAGLDYTVYSEAFADNDRSQAEGAGVGRIKMLLNEKEKPIGVQIMGPRAGDLIAEWAAALNGGVKLSTLASAVHPYPTIGEINKRVAGKFLSEKIFSEKIRKGLKFFFNFKGRACSLPGTD